MGCPKTTTRQRWRTTGNESNHKYHTVMHRHTRWHDCRITRSVITDDEQLSRLSEDILVSWSSMTAEVQKDLQQYRSFRDKIAISDCITMKGKRIIISVSLQYKLLNQLHINHIGIEKTRLQTCESIYWINMKSDIEEMVNMALHVLISKQHIVGTKWYQ